MSPRIRFGTIKAVDKAEKDLVPRGGARQRTLFDKFSGLNVRREEKYGNLI